MSSISSMIGTTARSPAAKPSSTNRSCGILSTTLTSLSSRPTATVEPEPPVAAKPIETTTIARSNRLNAPSSGSVANADGRSPHATTLTTTSAVNATSETYLREILRF